MKIKYNAPTPSKPKSNEAQAVSHVRCSKYGKYSDTRHKTKNIYTHIFYAKSLLKHHNHYITFFLKHGKKNENLRSSDTTHLVHIHRTDRRIRREKHKKHTPKALHTSKEQTHKLSVTHTKKVVKMLRTMDRRSVPMSPVSPQIELWLSAKTQSSHGGEVTIQRWRLAYKETRPKNSKACKQPSNSLL